MNKTQFTQNIEIVKQWESEVEKIRSSVSEENDKLKKEIFELGIQFESAKEHAKFLVEKINEIKQRMDEDFKLYFEANTVVQTLDVASNTLDFIHNKIHEAITFKQE
jgi:hypothetical protein